MKQVRSMRLDWIEERTHVSEIWLARVSVGA